MPDSVIKSFAIIAPAIVFSFGLYLLTRKEMGRQTTVSEHAGSNIKTTILLSVILFFAGALYFWTIWAIVGPKYNIPYFIYIFIVAALAQIVLALFPDRPQNIISSRAHKAAGVILIACIYVMVLLIATKGNIANSLLSFFIWLFVFAGPILIILRFFSVRYSREKLWFQIAYVVSFCVLLAFLVYV